MKKLIFIFTFLAFAFSSFGMTLHVHFCCGRVDEVKLVPISDKDCPVKKEERKKGCCDDRQVDIKIKDDYNKESARQLKLKAPETELPNTFESILTNEVVGYQVSYISSSSPPGVSSFPLYKQHCIFRI